MRPATRAGRWQQRRRKRVVRLVGSMFMKMRARSEAALRFTERLQREQEAPRLRERVPSLATLRLEITDGRGATNADPKHVKIIVVDTAPALFALTCGDHGCRDG